MSIRTLIADDETLARQRLLRLIGEHPDLKPVGEAATGKEAVAMALALRPDLLFLDIDMPEQDGLAALEQLHELLPDGQRPLVVFTTAYEEHALRAIELEGTDYLLKPIEKIGLHRALRRVRKRLGDSPAQSDGTQRPPEQPPLAPSPYAEGPDRLRAHRGNEIVSLKIARVAAVVLDDTIAYAHTPEGRFRLRQGLGELEDRLPSSLFLRISRSALVNLNWVAGLEPISAGRYLAKFREPLELALEVSRRRAAHLRERLGG